MWQQGGGSGWNAGDAAQWQSGDLLWNAIAEAVAGIMHLEKEWDSNKLEKKLREYFNKGAKKMAFNATKSLQEMVDEYADSCFSGLFAGLGEREWLYSGQADFLLVLDAGVKENFPAQLIMQGSQQEFEQTVLTAHDRAFEECRFYPVLTEAVANAVQGPKTKKKVYNAVEQGRKEAAQGEGVPCSTGDPTYETLEDFASRWIDRTIALLSLSMDGYPDQVIQMPLAISCFHEMTQKGALPLALTQETGPPPEGWPLIEAAVKTSFGNYGNGKKPVKAGAAAAAGPYGAVAGKGMGAYGAVAGKGMGAYGAVGFKGAYGGCDGKGAFGGCDGKGAFGGGGKGGGCGWDGFKGGW